MKFKEEVIFELEKDKPFSGFRDFRAKCQKKYGYSPSTDLCIRVNNYQLETYGFILNRSTAIGYVKDKNLKMTQHKRLLTKTNSSDHRAEEKFIERVSQNG